MDVDAATFNLDPHEIEAAITPRTTAILAVHCYGCPCDVDAIEMIARRHHLKVIYDAAHAFGVTWGGQSILKHGDLSVLSFHATKIFSTFEGGAIVCHDAATKRRLDVLRNFGISSELTVNVPGINGKLNEIGAAFGLLQLRYVDAAIRRNQGIDARYRDGLSQVSGIICSPGHEGSNCSYFAILVGPGYPVSRNQLYSRLHENGILARRYFYPLLCDFQMYAKIGSFPLDQARELANRVICLPIYPDLELDAVDRIVRLIAQM